MQKITTFESYLSSLHTIKTVRSYVYYVDVFLLRNPKSNKMQYQEILEYINHMKVNGCSQSQVNLTLAAIKKYFDYLVHTGKRIDHPCKGIKLHRKKKGIQIQELFSVEELERLMNRENRFNNLELRNKVIISLLIYQALSSAELCSLNLENVDLEAGTIYIKGSKKNAARTLELKPNQILLIQNYITTSRKNLLKSNTQRLLITQRGVSESTDGINSMIEPLKWLYPDRNLNPSTIRQSVISNKLNTQKYPLEEVQLFAGHKWPSSTELYKRNDIEEQREKINLWHPLK